jgi:hypothetical protein
LYADRAARGRGHAEERERHVGAPRAHEARHAQDLAPVQVEGDVLEHAVARQPLGLQHDLGRRGAGGLGEVVADLAPDHLGDHPLARHLGHGPGRDVAAVADHRDAVGDLEDLLEPVRDVDDRDALGQRGRCDPAQAPGLVGGQGGRGLVHDEHAHILGQGARDLDGLLFGQRQAARHLVHVEVHADAGDQVARPGALAGGPAQEALVARADEDVLGHVEIGEDHRLLVDRGHAHLARGLRAGIARGAPSTRIWPVVGWWMPVMILIMVDLPAPFSPTSACTSPAWRSSDRSVSAWVMPKDFDTPRNCMIGWAIWISGKAAAAGRCRRGPGPDPEPSSRRRAGYCAAASTFSLL